MSLIDWARARGIATGLVTNAPRENADLMIAVLGMGEAFDVVIAATELAHSKPHPEPYLAALASLGLDARHTLAIEDSATGIAAARAAGLDVVALATPRTAASIERSGATLIVADMTDHRLYELFEARFAAL
jgi:HAD superfamily hydrolase (TIGR01509 family)